jgi:hypothetical protein
LLLYPVHHLKYVDPHESRDIVGCLLPSVWLVLLDEALRLAGDWALLPVVSRANLTTLEGVISFTDILYAFRSSPQTGVIPNVP